jgi:membrane-associated phospholipid phosphatase
MAKFPRRTLRLAIGAWCCAGICITLLVAPCRAQRDSSSAASALRGWTIVAAAVAIAAAEDGRLSAFARTHQRPALDRLADVVDPFGRAGTLVPALVASVVIPRGSGEQSLSNAALRIGLAYGTADGVESILKPLVGRHRPSDAGDPWRFHPLSGTSDWHSFPSAHTTHAFSLAMAFALEARTPKVAVPAFGVATLVGIQRVYRGQHWPSDVVASAALAVAVARAADRVLRRSGIPHVLPPTVSATP